MAITAERATTAEPGIARAGLPRPLRVALNFARSKPLGAMGAMLIVLLIVTAVFAAQIAPYDPDTPFYGDKLQAPTAKHIFGTDNFGRDVFSRVVYGSRVSLFVGFISVGLGTLGGTIIGLVSGFKGGIVDLVIQRIVDATMAFPGLILALAIVAVLGPSLINAFLAIVIVLAPGASRVVRGAVLSVKSLTYIEAARAQGCSEFRLLWRHVLPNVMAPIIVIASVALGNAILIEASLSFLGLGVQPPTASWGNMLSGASRPFFEHRPTLALFPGLAISLAIFGFNLFGDAMRDVLDPRLRGSR